MEYVSTVELAGVVKAVTDRAILFQEEESGIETWLPITYIDTYDEIVKGNTVTIEIPEWIALDRDFI